MKLSYFVSLACLFFQVPARADNPLDVRAYMERFHAAPALTMNDRLVKVDGAGKILPENPQVTFEERASRREKLLGPWSEIPASENPEPLLAGLRIEYRLDKMEEKGWTKSQLKTSPWSGSYWPTRNGGLGWRYGDPEFPKDAFAEKHAYFMEHPASSVADPIYLSPAEKYDLLIGDSEFSLTLANWKKGLSVLPEKPDVPKWYGICHGWAPAAYLVDEPKKEVTLTREDGLAITFFPDDVKALASALWGESKTEIVFLGKKCTKPDPVEDDMGRVIDPECFNTNPGTWHLATVNRLAAGHESFVMDASFDAEIWNQPVASYKYSYFNPQTLETSTRLAQAILPIEKFTIDKFKKYRSPSARYVVGIFFDVTYVNESTPSADGKPVAPVKKTVRYLYDLELDRGQRIIGGEWYTNKHPDFIWAPVGGFQPLSYGETQMKERVSWSGEGAFPEALKSAARESSPLAEPLAAVVQELVKRAKK